MRGALDGLLQREWFLYLEPTVLLEIKLFVLVAMTPFFQEILVAAFLLGILYKLRRFYLPVHHNFCTFCFP